MLNKIKEFSQQKKSWFLFSTFCLFLELSALFVQHVLNFNPCMICVQQRALFLVLMLISFAGAFFRKTKASYLFLISMIGITADIMFLAIKKVRLENNNDMFSVCSIERPFPKWLQLDEIIPYVFKNVGSCSDKDINVIGLTLSGHLIIISGIMLSVLVIVLFSKIFKRKK